METKKVEPLSTEEMAKIYGGNSPQQQHDHCATGKDDIDCSSEGASGGSTTDTE